MPPIPANAKRGMVPFQVVDRSSDVVEQIGLRGGLHTVVGAMHPLKTVPLIPAAMQTIVTPLILPVVVVFDYGSSEVRLSRRIVQPSSPNPKPKVVFIDVIFTHTKTVEHIVA